MKHGLKLSGSDSHLSGIGIEELIAEILKTRMQLSQRPPTTNIKCQALDEDIAQATAR